jgi:hypothetical protein
MHSLVALRIFDKTEHAPMTGRGRPRATRQEEALREMIQRGAVLDTLVAENLGPSRKSPPRLAFEAACLFLILQHGSEYQKARCGKLIERIRRMKLASVIEAELTDQNFLERVIQLCARNWESHRVR